MWSTSQHRRAAVSIVTILFVVAAPAFATLGENVATVQADQAHMRATVRVTRTSAYTLQWRRRSVPRLLAAKIPLLVEQAAGRGSSPVSTQVTVLP